MGKRRYSPPKIASNSQEEGRALVPGDAISKSAAHHNSNFKRPHDDASTVPAQSVAEPALKRPYDAKKSSMGWQLPRPPTSTSTSTTEGAAPLHVAAAQALMTGSTTFQVLLRRNSTQDRWGFLTYKSRWPMTIGEILEHGLHTIIEDEEVEDFQRSFPDVVSRTYPLRITPPLLLCNDVVVGIDGVYPASHVEALELFRNAGLRICLVVVRHAETLSVKVGTGSSVRTLLVPGPQQQPLKGTVAGVSADAMQQSPSPNAGPNMAGHARDGDGEDSAAQSDTSSNSSSSSSSSSSSDGSGDTQEHNDDGDTPSLADFLRDAALAAAASSAAQAGNKVEGSERDHDDKDVDTDPRGAPFTAEERERYFNTDPMRQCVKLDSLETAYKLQLAQQKELEAEEEADQEKKEDKEERSKTEGQERGRRKPPSSTTASTADDGKPVNVMKQLREFYRNCKRENPFQQQPNGVGAGLEEAFKALPTPARHAVYDRSGCPFSSTEGFTDAFHVSIQQLMTRLALGQATTKTTVKSRASPPRSSSQEALVVSSSKSSPFLTGTVEFVGLARTAAAAAHKKFKMSNNAGGGGDSAQQHSALRQSVAAKAALIEADGAVKAFREKLTSHKTTLAEAHTTILLPAAEAALAAQSEELAKESAKLVECERSARTWCDLFSTHSAMIQQQEEQPKSKFCKKKNRKKKERAGPAFGNRGGEGRGQAHYAHQLQQWFQTALMGGGGGGGIGSPQPMEVPSGSFSGPAAASPHQQWRWQASSQGGTSQFGTATSTAPSYGINAASGLPLGPHPPDGRQHNYQSPSFQLPQQQSGSVPSGPQGNSQRGRLGLPLPPDSSQ